MPRARVSEDRRRVAKACTLCQTDKKKCDGLRPCRQCIKRERSDSCAYSSHKRVYGRQRPLPKDVDMANAVPDQNNTGETENSPVGYARERNSPLGKHIAIPKLPNIMRDTKGRASKSSLICAEPTHGLR